MTIERALAVEGWMSYSELTYLACTAEKSPMILEIGSWLGRSTCALAANTTGTVWAVDTWEGTAEQGFTVDKEQLFSEFLHNTSGLPIVPVMQHSRLAVRQLSRLRFDMIFIDAAHDYESVKSDISTYFPLLRRGGIICGHDHHNNWPGVKQAVGELLPVYKVIDTIWTSEVL